jgi:hypothetical protein
MTRNFQRKNQTKEKTVIVEFGEFQPCYLSHGLAIFETKTCEKKKCDN